MKSLRPKRQLKRSGVFSLAILVSLLLHLILGTLLLNQQIVPEAQPPAAKTPINLRVEPRWIELDQQPEQIASEPPPEASPLASDNQRVEKETAPKGEDSRDSRKSVPRQQLSSQTPPPIIPSPQQPPPGEEPPSVARQTAPDGERPPPTGPDRPQPRIPIELPNLQDLTSLAPTTLARLDRQQNRIKDRPEVALEDDAVWLNLQKMDNKLLSFFRRFHDRVEAVWNYPVEASSRGVEGTLLVKILINKKGELLDVLPLESSGSDILDYEAITAVYRAAPFGPLPSYYEHEQLKIYAHFQYSLVRRMIYGRP